MTHRSICTFIRIKAWAATSRHYFSLTRWRLRVTIVSRKTDIWGGTWGISCSTWCTFWILRHVTACPALTLPVVIAASYHVITSLTDWRWWDAFRICTFSALTLNIWITDSTFQFRDALTHSKVAIAAIFIKSADPMVRILLGILLARVWFPFSADPVITVMTDRTL